MQPKRLVVVGCLDTLAQLRSLFKPFRDAGWTVEETTEVSEVKAMTPPDLIFVFAYGDMFFAEFEEWIDHPKTIWYYHPRVDFYPRNVTKISDPVFPSAVFQLAQELIAG